MFWESRGIWNDVWERVPEGKGVRKGIRNVKGERGWFKRPSQEYIEESYERLVTQGIASFHCSEALDLIHHMYAYIKKQQGELEKKRFARVGSTQPLSIEGPDDDGGSYLYDGPDPYDDDGIGDENG
jgi:hypothetical protein